MHRSSYEAVKRFRGFADKAFPAGQLRVLDVGSRDVNGTYKDIFSNAERYLYTGLDVAPGPNVDYVPADPYRWDEVPDGLFDIVISGQAFEHIEFPWLTMEQIGLKLKVGGLACIIAPSRGPEHRYPVDCWRIYPDGMRALAKWAKLDVIDVKTAWGRNGLGDGSDIWGDTCCVLRKGRVYEPGTVERGNASARIEDKFEQLCGAKSDINEHLPVLRHYASQCNHVTEFGVRGIVSTWALLAGRPGKMVSYDINPPQGDIGEVYEAAKGSTSFRFVQADVLTVTIEPTDLLFIDTFHTYRQLKQELELHANRVRDYIILHDTATYGGKGEDGGEGLRKAIDEFLLGNAGWRIIEERRNNNGLIVLERVPW